MGITLFSFWSKGKTEKMNFLSAAETSLNISEDKQAECASRGLWAALVPGLAATTQPASGYAVSLTWDPQRTYWRVWPMFGLLRTGKGILRHRVLLSHWALVVQPLLSAFIFLLGNHGVPFFQRHVWLAVHQAKRSCMWENGILQEPRDKEVISRHLQSQAWPCDIKSSTLHHLRESGFMLKQREGGNPWILQPLCVNAFSLSAKEYIPRVHPNGSV